MTTYEAVLDGVGPRLRALRQEREATLADVSAATGVSISTLSRLESGSRKPTLELLLPLAGYHRVAIDDLVSAPPAADPRVHPKPVHRRGMTMVPLSNNAGGLQAYKLTVAATKGHQEPSPQTHEGYEWLYVLSGRLRLVLGEHDVVLKAGEAAEFNTRTPHWFGAAGSGPVEFLSLFGPQGERMHVRARPTRAAD
ncbi:XRE family transcriptional regulator [Acidothermaceae bacterium B102]|nr:XRE family transcriptional regulator [Acidothermaceae bacterium B102]